MVLLNLGCGNNKIDGYLNCDISPSVNPDCIVDLETKLPFDDDSVDGVYLRHVLEHVNNFIPLMHELHRVCRSGAVIDIVVPFYASYGQYNDPTHVRFFTPFTFDYFVKSNYAFEVCNGSMFEIVSVKLNFGFEKVKPLKYIINAIFNISLRLYCRFCAWIFPANEIYFKLKVL